jgi:hypothetical protein
MVFPTWVIPPNISGGEQMSLGKSIFISVERRRKEQLISANIP